MSWTETSLDGLFHIKHGYAVKSEFFGTEGRQIVLTPGNFQEAGGFRLRPEKERYYTQEPPEAFVLGKDDLIVAMTEQGEGLLGSSAFVPGDNSYLHNQRIGLVEELDETRLRKRYLYLLLNTRNVRAQIRASASGTKVRHTSPKRIYAVTAKLPSPVEQDRIADILFAYDDLIENNRRRIGFLEEAARLLYREWFVHFRFPGHEHVRMIDGLPEGWQRQRLGQVVQTNLRNYRAKTLPEIIQYVDLSAVRMGRIAERVKLTASEAPGRARRLCSDGDIIWANVRPNLLGYALILNPAPNDVFSTGFTVLTSVDVPFSWTYLSVTTPTFIAHLVNHATGAGYPAVRPNDFERAEVMLPDRAVLVNFHESVKTNFLMIDSLEAANLQLARARDLLLPRLMSGELVV